MQQNKVRIKNNEEFITSNTTTKTNQIKMRKPVEQGATSKAMRDDERKILKFS